MHELGLSLSTTADIEREVMGETIETLLTRQERAAREEERKKRLAELYARVRRLHRDQEWQAVVDKFGQIHEVEPNYPDPEGLLDSARQALLEQQERAAKEEQYRKAVEEVWSDNKVSSPEAQRLAALASELGLSTDTAADIERDRMSDTVEAILQRQAREEEERQRHLEELYAQARRLHRDREWQAVVDKFGQIHEVEPNYPDPERLLDSARQAFESRQRVAEAYDRGQRHMDAGEWQQALGCFKKVRRLEPGYRQTEELLSQVRQELTPPPRVEVPNLSGQTVHQAITSLTAKAMSGKRLELGSQREILSDTIPEGQIIEQRPLAGTKVEAGSLVNVTMSKGPSRVEVPDLTGQLLPQAREALINVGLKLGGLNEVPSATMPKGRILRQNPAWGTKAKRGTSVSVTLSSGQANIIVSAGRRRLDPRIFVGGLVALALLILGGWFLSLGGFYSGGGDILVSVRDNAHRVEWQPVSYKDAIVEVDATDKTINPTGTNYWGVACRIRDRANFYSITIANIGEASITRHSEGEKENLTRKSSKAFDPAAVNHMRAACVGRTLTLYVNDQKLAEATDTEFSRGYVGMYVEDKLMERGDTDSPVKVKFDNFGVSIP